MSEPAKTAEERLLEVTPTWGGDVHNAALDAVIKEFQDAHPAPAPVTPPSYEAVLQEVREAQANEATERAAFAAIEAAGTPAEREAAVERYAKLVSAKRALVPVPPDYSWSDFDKAMDHTGVQGPSRSRVRALGEAAGWSPMLSVQLQAAIDTMPDPATLPALAALNDRDGGALGRALRGVDLDRVSRDGWLKSERVRAVLVEIGHQLRA